MFGEGAPSSLVVGPIDNEGRANGAIELGAMHPLTERDQRFLELVSGNIGDCVDAAQYRERLQQVLEETQQLNEELQTQQEELRTSNKELEQQTNDQLADQARALDERNAALSVAQTEFEERTEALQRASRYKFEFLANMSYELRTPLNSSLIFARLLAENKSGNLTSDQIKYAETIYSAGNGPAQISSTTFWICRRSRQASSICTSKTCRRSGSSKRIIEALARTFGRSRGRSA